MALIDIINNNNRHHRISAKAPAKKAAPAPKKPTPKKAPAKKAAPAPKKPTPKKAPAPVRNPEAIYLALQAKVRCLYHAPYSEWQKLALLAAENIQIKNIILDVLCPLWLEHPFVSRLVDEINR